MKKTIFWLIIVIFILSLTLIGTGCKEEVAPAEEVTEEVTEEEVAPAEEEAIEPATITFWHTYNVESNEYITLADIIIPKFEEQNPNITVVEQLIPYDDFHTKLVTSIAGEIVPDVVRMDIIWVPEFAEMGALASLDSYNSFSTIAEQVFPGPLNTCKWGDSYFGLPLTTNTRILFWNKAMFGEAGIEGPPTTWDEFADAAEKLTKPEETWGINISYYYPWNIMPWIWSGGGDITDEDITTATGYINGENSVNALQLLVDLINKGYVADTINRGGIATQDGYASNVYGMFVGGPWFYGMIRGQFPDAEINTTLMPAGTAGGSASVIGGEDLVIFEGSENKEAAYKFVEFMVSEETQLILAETGQMPVLNTIAESDYIKNHEYYPVFLEQLKTARPRTVHPGWSEMQAALKLGFEKAIYGEKTVQEALDGVANEINAIMEEYK